MTNARFFKFSQAVILAWFAFYSLASHAGTISVTPTTASGDTTGINTISDTRLYYAVTNVGTTNLNITNVTGTSEFLIEQPSALVLPVTILPGASYFVVVSFKPSAAGNRSGTVTILSNDPVKPSTPVTGTGYGGTETSIRLTPAPALPATAFEVELGQGTGLRANVTFDNGAVGPALLNWTSSNTGVATVAASDFDLSFGGSSVPTGNVTTKALGTTTITVSGVQAPTVKASTTITVVAASNHEFLGTVISDRIVRVQNGVWSLCYDFPEVDIDNRPAYETNQIGVTTPSLNAIGSIYVTADYTLGTDGVSEQAFYLSKCDPTIPPNPAIRTTVFDQPLSLASFRDLVVESVGRGGNAVASNTTGSDLWQFTPTTSFPISRLGLPVDDIGALAIDSFDNTYMSNLIATSTMQTAGVYVRPTVFTCPLGNTWCPIAAVFGTIFPSSAGVPGMAAIYESNKGYAMKLVAVDKAIVERYVDLNKDGSYFKIVGTTIVADPGEIVEVAVVDAGVDISVDANRNLIVQVAEPLGRTIVKMTDKNNDGDFKDAGEYKVIYQSTLFTRLKDIAFAAPCGDKPPTAVINTLPPSGVAELGVPLVLLGGGSFDPCNDVLTYLWTDEDKAPPTTLCTTTICSITYTGLPALHKVGLQVTDPAGASNKTVMTMKAGPPTISGFWPGSGVTNTVVFLFGKNYQVASGKSPIVCFKDGTVCQPLVQVLSPDLLFTLQPGPASTIVGKITVETDIGKASSAVNYPSTALGLNITGVWPGSIKIGAFDFIFGGFFSLTPGANKVDVNGVVAPLVQVIDTTLLAYIVPAGATTGPVHVTTGGVTATSPSNLVILP